MRAVLLLMSLAFGQSESITDHPTLAEFCETSLKELPMLDSAEDLAKACAKVKQLPNCQSMKGLPIFHYDRAGVSKNPKRIFVKSLIHGDETMAGVMGRAWMTRLEKIDPRNSWRVVPIANPDGWKLKTRMNANGVDLNRNFPTKDWEKSALDYWKKNGKLDPRRNPGTGPASEIETQCLVSHFEDFKPDFLISVHTPLGVLDLDGPKMRSPPSFRPLPWISLGNFPGSLGRYMWVDRKIPVLTIELKGNEDLKKLEEFDRLQDIAGTIAIQAGRLQPKVKKPVSRKSDSKSASNSKE
ncbi:MAG: M14 family zinc carboxypeptidase [Bdellovibrionales bacterium]